LRQLIYNMQVYIIGCGGNAKVVADICEANQYQIMGFFDDKYDGTKITVYHKYQLLGKILDIDQYPGICVVNSVGDCRVRHRISKKLAFLDLQWINCIHPAAQISPTAKLGKGNIICYGAMINADAVLGDFNLINTMAVVEHDCQVGHFNHLAPKSVMCGGVSLGNENLLGVGSTVIPGKKIGHNNIIGAMTVIIHDISDDKTVVGIPGKILVK